VTKSCALNVLPMCSESPSKDRPQNNAMQRTRDNIGRSGKSKVASR
jgi:hypothetical protein